MKTVVLFLACGLAWPHPVRAEEKKPVRTYTNEDLVRVSPLRGETGALSEPAQPLRAAPPPAERLSTRHVAEAHWRREAQRLRDRLRPMRQRAAELRLRLDELRRRPPAPHRGRAADATRGAAAPEALEARLRALEAEIRERESAFEDEARRAGALPGWIR